MWMAQANVGGQGFYPMQNWIEQEPYESMNPS